ncbi:MAG: alpha/beta fold hydrolase [Herpetosiphon sp.]
MAINTSELGQMQVDGQRMADRYQTWQRVMTTKAAIAQSPKEVIWTLNKAKLYRYTPVVPAEQRHATPLLLVFALMNRPSVLDLRPGSSFVEFMVKQGFDVYLLDWGTPGPEDRHLDFADYALEYLPRAIRKVKKTSGSSEFSILGWCLGALVSTVYAALQPNDGLKNLILLTAPLNFESKEKLRFARWTSGDNFPIDKILDTFGNMPGELIDFGAKALKPVENWVGNYVRLWDNLDNPRVVEAWHAMNTWINDLTPMAGGFYKQLITEFYRENRLMNGTLTIRGRHVDLANVTANVLNVTAADDHITPTCQSDGVMERLGSNDKTLLPLKGGHIGVLAGSAAVKSAWPQVQGWLAARSK